MNNIWKPDQIESSFLHTESKNFLYLRELVTRIAQIGIEAIDKLFPHEIGTINRARLIRNVGSHLLWIAKCNQCEMWLITANPNLLFDAHGLNVEHISISDQFLVLNTIDYFLAISLQSTKRASGIIDMGLIEKLRMIVFNCADFWMELKIDHVEKIVALFRRLAALENSVELNFRAFTISIYEIYPLVAALTSPLAPYYHYVIAHLIGNCVVESAKTIISEADLTKLSSIYSELKSYLSEYKTGGVVLNDNDNRVEEIDGISSTGSSPPRSNSPNSDLLTEPMEDGKPVTKKKMQQRFLLVGHDTLELYLNKNMILDNMFIEMARVKHNLALTYSQINDEMRRLALLSQAKEIKIKLG